MDTWKDNNVLFTKPSRKSRVSYLQAEIAEKVGFKEAFSNLVFFLGKKDPDLQLELLEQMCKEMHIC